MAPNGCWLVTVDDGVIRTWNASTGYPIATLGAHGRLVTISRDNRWIVSAGKSGEESRRLYVWDSWTGAPRA